MIKKIIQSTITEYDKPSELSAEDRNLLNEAGKATGNSYSPYSEFKVGAAALLSNGEIVTGSNQENASYQLAFVQSVSHSLLYQLFIQNKKLFRLP